MPEDELLEALRGLGSDHEPDVAAIRRRMDEERSTVVPLRRRVEPGPRRRPVLLSAAAAILIGGGVTVAVSQMSPSDGGTPAKDLPVVIPTFATPSPDKPSPSAAPSEKKSSRTPDGVSTSRPMEPSTPTHEEKPPKSASSSVARLQASHELAPLLSGQKISLGDVNEDWLAIGARNDLKTVRKKASQTTPLLNFDAPDSAASVDSQFRLSWSGGIPEQDRPDSTRWLQTDGAVVTVTASSAARTVTLYTGNTMNVLVKGQGLKDHRVVLGDQELGYVVTLQIPSHAGDTTIELQSGRGPVHLIAATASSR